MFVIVIKRGLVVGLHDFHLIEYAITCSFSFLSCGRLGFAGWRIFGVEQILYFCYLSYIGGGGGAVCFLDVDFMWFLVLTMAWLNNLLLKVLLPVLSEVPRST